MPPRRKPAKTDSWSACKLMLKDWPRPGVVALVQELYRLSDDNRRFLHARLLAEARPDAGVAETINVIRRMLTPSAIWNERFRHIEVKRAIDRFEKAVANPASVAEVLLADLQTSLQTFSEIGDYEPIVDHIYATMKRLDDCLEALDPSAATPLVRALCALADRWGGKFGWGVSDELLDMAAQWRLKSAS